MKDTPLVLRSKKEQEVAMNCGYIHDRLGRSGQELLTVLESVKCYGGTSSIPLERSRLGLAHQAYMLDKIATELLRERSRIGILVSSIKRFIQDERIADGNEPLSSILPDQDNGI